MPNLTRDYDQKPHPKRRIVHRRFIFPALGTGLGALELFHVLYPSGEHELRTIRYEGPNETTGRRKFYEMAQLSIPYYGVYIGNTSHMQLPEVFRMQETNT